MFNVFKGDIAFLPVFKILKASGLSSYIYRILPAFLKEYANKIKRRLHIRELRRKGIIKLNLGCGDDIKYDYINIDKYNPEADLNMDICKLRNFRTDTVCEINAKWVLEHLPRNIQVLKEWRRVLKPGGKLTVRVPNFELYLREYLEGDLDYKMGIKEDKEGHEGWGIINIFGHDKDGMYHTNGFTVDTLKKTLEEAGFRIKKCEIMPNLQIRFEYRENGDIYCEAVK